jgi:hypothetical protein
MHFYRLMVLLTFVPIYSTTAYGQDVIYQYGGITGRVAGGMSFTDSLSDSATGQVWSFSISIQNLPKIETRSAAGISETFEAFIRTSASSTATSFDSRNIGRVNARFFKAEIPFYFNNSFVPPPLRFEGEYLGISQWRRKC